MMKEKYVLQVLNPRSVRKIENFQGLTAPRLTSLDGKRIAMISGKHDAGLFIDPLKEHLQKRYPTATFDRLLGKRSIETEIEVLRNYDAFVFGVRNTGGTNTEEATDYERAGIPGVVITIDANCYDQQLRCALISGLPTVRFALISAERWFAAANKPENFISFAEESVDTVVRALTDPLTDEEKNPKFPEYDYSELRFEGVDYTDAFDKFQTYFLENELCDGIAVAPPTPEAVTKMLAGTSRRPDEVIPGLMPPGRGIVTVEKIAVNAVMAGAKPEYLPVIITAVEMLCDARFYAWHHFTSMNSTNLLVAVGGPIAKELGMNSGVGYLGPGNRANSSIGRAISLCGLNLGWIEYTKMDGGMFGQPSQFCNLVFCENDELSPWEPYQVSQGFSAGDSTVMIEEVFHIDGCFWNAIDYMPSGVWTYGLKADLDRIARMAAGHKPNLELASKGLSEIHLFPTLQKDPLPMINGQTYMLILYPGQARQLANAGFTRESLTEYIGNRYRIPWVEFDKELQEGILKLAESGVVPGLSVSDCKPGGTIPMINTDRLALLVAGPISGQTLGLQCLGSVNIRDDVMPVGTPSSSRSPYFIKKITGATLTEAGK
jgi:hypothetical protein